MKPSLEVVVGGQFGSEAKGHVVQRLTERALHDKDGHVGVVRVAGPNAGHTGYDSSGQRWALRQVPVAAVTGSDRVTMGIAAGSEIDPPVLFDEYDRLTAANLNPNLWVSPHATLIEDVHKMREANHNLVDKIGSTGKGIGAARADRLMRSGQAVFQDPAFMAECTRRGILVPKTDSPVTATMSQDDHVIIEGTQGYGLGLHTEFYPQVTSSDCRAADFMAMAGVHAWDFEEVEVWVVARVYPIRVAGNSGPLKDETTWEELGLPEERTTVTQKVRRVGLEDWDLVRRAVKANGGAPTVRLALTMLDQKFSDLADKYLATPMWEPPQGRTADYIGFIERETGAKVELVTTGPNTATFI